LASVPASSGAETGSIVISRKPAPGQQRPDPIGIGERECAGSARARRRGRVAVCGDRFRRHDAVIVAREFLPADKGDSAAGPQRSTEIGERLDRVIEEHDAELTDHDIKLVSGTVVGLDIAALVPNIRQALLFGAHPRLSQHRRREVDAERGSLVSELGRDASRFAAAATYIQHVVGRSDRRGLE
jgi:hypothetical protein